MDASIASPTAALARAVGEAAIRSPFAGVSAREDDSSALTDRSSADVSSVFSLARGASTRATAACEPETRLVDMEARADALEGRLRREAAAEAAAEAATRSADARESSLREALRAKERAIESLSVSLASTREAYERRLRAETEASAASAAREAEARESARTLRERMRALETKDAVREQKIASQDDAIARLTRELEAKKAFTIEVNDRARALELERLEQRARASEERAASLESRLEACSNEKASLQREIEALRERLASAPSQDALEEAFRVRVERAAEARIAAERLAFEESRTKDELAQVFGKIREMTLQAAGATASSRAHESRASVDAELQRVRRDVDAEIEAHRAEFRRVQTAISRENGQLHSELTQLRAKLDEKLRGAAPRAVKTSRAARRDDRSPWAAEFSFTPRGSPSESDDSFIEISPRAK